MPLRRTDTKRLLCVYGVLVAAALAGCAVGPDFRRPAPPAVSSYTADALPGETVESKVAGGGTQRFVSGEDIPRITSYNVCYTKLLRSGDEPLCSPAGDL